MLSAVLLLVSVTLVCVLAPQVLERIDTTERDPALVLIAWLGTIVGVAAATVASAVVLLLPDHGAAVIPRAWSSHRTWHHLLHGASTGAESTAGIVGFALVAAVAMWLGRRVIRASRHRHDVSDAHAATLRTIGRVVSSRPTVVRLDHRDPIAFTLSGSSDVIVATEGVFRLGTAAVAAVLAHERAHLRGRHHILVMWTSVLGKALPFVPLFRAAPSAVAEAVEMVADEVAVRECGAGAVSSALACMAARDSPTIALAMADTAIQLRLARLTKRRPRRTGPLGPAATRVGTAALAVTAPLLIMVIVLHVALLV